jgi:hypothetical protein
MHRITCARTGNQYVIHQADPSLVPPEARAGKWYFCAARFAPAGSERLLNEPHDYSNAYDSAEDAEAAARLWDLLSSRPAHAVGPGDS